MNYEDFKGIPPLPANPFYTDEEYTSLRRLKIMVFLFVLNSSEEFKVLSDDKKIAKVSLIEHSCLNEAVRKSRENKVRCTWTTNQFKDIYNSICYNLLSMMCLNVDTGSPALINKILTESIDLKNIARMSCKDLCPEKYTEINKVIEKRSSAEHTVKCTSLYYCRKCKQNKTTAVPVQNRSGDEGNTYLITCVFCHNKWYGG